MEKIELEGIGHIKYAIMEGDEQVSPFIELMSIFIEPQFRRRGYGTKLIRKLVRIAHKKGITCIYVKATEENQSFRRFLQNNRFNVSPKVLYQKRSSIFKRLKKKLDVVSTLS